MGELMDNEQKRHHEELRTLHEDIGRIRDRLEKGGAPQHVVDEIHVQPLGAISGTVGGQGRMSDASIAGWQARTSNAGNVAGEGRISNVGDVGGQGRTSHVGDAIIDISERSDDDSMPDAEANGRLS